MSYNPCESRELESGYRKIALYADTAGKPTHVARQLANGEWTSKIGKNEDIVHATLDQLEGDQYGHIVRIFRKNISPNH